MQQFDGGDCANQADKVRGYDDAGVEAKRHDIAGSVRL
jgi:hypothetical protein